MRVAIQKLSLGRSGSKTIARSSKCTPFPHCWQNYRVSEWSNRKTRKRIFPNTYNSRFSHAQQKMTQEFRCGKLQKRQNVLIWLIYSISHDRSIETYANSSANRFIYPSFMARNFPTEKIVLRGSKHRIREKNMSSQIRPCHKVPRLIIVLNTLVTTTIPSIPTISFNLIWKFFIASSRQELVGTPVRLCWSFQYPLGFHQIIFERKSKGIIAQNNLHFRRKNFIFNWKSFWSAIRIVGRNFRS